MDHNALLSRRGCRAVAARVSPVQAVVKATVVVCSMSLIMACGSNSGAQGNKSSEQLRSDDSTIESDKSAAGRPTGAGGSVPIDITAELGGKTYSLRGEGECTYAEQAYIRGVPSSMWQVQYRGRDEDISHTSVTVWRPEGGGVDQLSVSLQGESGEHHRINTVVGLERSGSGAVLLRPQGDGIRLELDGRDQGGKTVRLMIACARLMPAVVEGG